MPPDRVCSRQKNAIHLEDVNVLISEPLNMSRYMAKRIYVMDRIMIANQVFKMERLSWTIQMCLMKLLGSLKVEEAGGRLIVRVIRHEVVSTSHCGL